MRCLIIHLRYQRMPLEYLKAFSVVHFAIKEALIYLVTLLAPIVNSRRWIIKSLLYQWEVIFQTSINILWLKGISHKVLPLLIQARIKSCRRSRIHTFTKMFFLNAIVLFRDSVWDKIQTLVVDFLMMSCFSPLTLNKTIAVISNNSSLKASLAKLNLQAWEMN